MSDTSPLMIFANLYDFVNASPGEIHIVSIATTWYVQTNESRPVAKPNWIPSATWTPVPGGLCSCSEFQEDMARYNNEKSSWFQLAIFGELGLNIQGRSHRRRLCCQRAEEDRRR